MTDLRATAKAVGGPLDGQTLPARHKFLSNAGNPLTEEDRCELGDPFPEIYVLREDGIYLHGTEFDKHLPPELQAAAPELWPGVDSFFARFAYSKGHDPIEYAVEHGRIVLGWRTPPPGSLPITTADLDQRMADHDPTVRRIIGELLDAGWTPPVLPEPPGTGSDS